MTRRDPQYIARWRTERNITQKDFAERCGISAGKLSGIELGQDVRVGYLKSIAHEMKINVVVLQYYMGIVQLSDIAELVDLLGIVTQTEAEARP